MKKDENKLWLKLCQVHVQFKLEFDLIRWRFVHFSFGFNQNDVNGLSDQKFRLINKKINLHE